MIKKPVKYYVVDAFTESAFKGNPAAICLLEDKRDEKWLQAVATEFNLSQTCYLTQLITGTDSADSPTHPRFALRWFTPVAEVTLCGHGTLAASYFLFAYGLVKTDTIEYSTLSGILTAKRIPDTQNGTAQEGFYVELNFPIIPLTEFNPPDISPISKSLNGASVLEIQKTSGDDLFVVLPSGKEVAQVIPNFSEIEKCPGRGIIITGPASPESGFDFFSRFFVPTMGINEDPVCGSAHCALAPYWAKKLGKSDLVAYQASSRSGVIKLHVDEKNQRVSLRGKAIVVMEGSILV